MDDKIKLHRAVIVEGKYDKIKLESFIDALIIPTGGFGIFKNSEKKEYIKRLAAERGLLIITDSDSAGFLIRNHLKKFIDGELIKNCYVPGIKGKEARKEKESKEGLLGVEGLSREILTEALRKCGAFDEVKAQKTDENRRVFTAADLFNLGLTGGEGSAEKKKAFLKKLSLPEYLSNKALLNYLNTCDVKITENIEELLK